MRIQMNIHVYKSQNKVTNTSESKSSECNTSESIGNRRHWGLMAFLSICSCTMFYFICKTYQFFLFEHLNMFFCWTFCSQTYFQYVPALLSYTFWTKATFTGLTLQKCVFAVHVCTLCFILYLDWFGRFDLRKGWHVRRVLKCASVYWQSLLRRPCGVCGTFKSSDLLALK